MKITAQRTSELWTSRRLTTPCRKRRTIVAALGQKGVRYGVGAIPDGGRYFPRALLIWVTACKAESYDIGRDGLVVSYTACPRGYGLLEEFLSSAEAVREILPDLCIGISEGFVPGAASVVWIFTAGFYD